MGVVSRRGVWVALVLIGATGCNPFDAFAECDYQNIDVDSVDVDVEAAREAFLGEYLGTLTWTRTQASTNLIVNIARSDANPITAESDCDGALDGFNVPLRVSTTSDDGLVEIHGDYALRLDKSGKFKSISSETIGGSVDFDNLKAAGITPPEWVSNFSPVLKLPLSVPDLVPQNGSVTADFGPFDNRMTLELGTVEFP